MRRAWYRRSPPGPAVRMVAATSAAGAAALAPADLVRSGKLRHHDRHGAEQVFVSKPVSRTVCETKYVDQYRTRTVPVTNTSRSPRPGPRWFR